MLISESKKCWQANFVTFADIVFLCQNVHNISFIYTFSSSFVQYIYKLTCIDQTTEVTGNRLEVRVKYCPCTCTLRVFFPSGIQVLMKAFSQKHLGKQTQVNGGTVVKPGGYLFQWTFLGYSPTGLHHTV